MAIGPRLDLRQSQSLVMTPQLRQAIKLLQFSNIEVASFVDEELERNPLLERDEIAEGGPLERPAIDQIEALAPARDLTDTIRSETLPTEGASPLDAEHAETYDPGTNSDGGGRMDLHGNGARGFDDGERTIDDFAAASRTLREHLSEQVRLTFSDPAERMIAAHLLAILDPSGRLSAMPEALAAALGTDINRVDALRPGRHVRA
jgi:RNA polymerase sigma-54 factor